MGLTIPEEETEVCRQPTRSAWIVAALTNCLVSREKEYDEATRTAAKSVVNAIWVLMTEYSVAVDQAKQMCRTITENNVTSYRGVVDNNKDNTSLSLDLRRPRYNPGAKYNSLQTSMMENGVAETLKSCPKHIDKDTGELEAQKHSKPDSSYSTTPKREFKDLAMADERRVEISVVEIDLEN
ncbi:MAG: hypothetical protein Q9214_001213 [Letrouitia sp. 1 TL-2023]